MLNILYEAYNWHWKHSFSLSLSARILSFEKKVFFRFLTFVALHRWKAHTPFVLFRWLITGKVGTWYRYREIFNEFHETWVRTVFIPLFFVALLVIWYSRSLHVGHSMLNRLLLYFCSDFYFKFFSNYFFINA